MKTNEELLKKIEELELQLKVKNTNQMVEVRTEKGVIQSEAATNPIYLGIYRYQDGGRRKISKCGIGRIRF